MLQIQQRARRAGPWRQEIRSCADDHRRHLQSTEMPQQLHPSLPLYFARGRTSLSAPRSQLAIRRALLQLVLFYHANAKRRSSAYAGHSVRYIAKQCASAAHPSGVSSTYYMLGDGGCELLLHARVRLDGEGPEFRSRQGLQLARGWTEV